MNLIFLRSEKNLSVFRPGVNRLAIFCGFVIISASPFAPRSFAQAKVDPAAEFRSLSEELSEARLGAGEESEAHMERALAYLDSVAVSVLNVSPQPDLDAANRTLAALVSHTPPIGENYRLVKLGGVPASYAMVINLGPGGPAAVRIYAGTAGHYALAARIDHFVLKDFFDSDLELVPVSNSEAVFVVVSGRTDDLSTGLFSAWWFDGHRMVALWNSDLLQQSTYAADGNGLSLAYCSQVDDDRPSQCLKMSRDLYRFQDRAWKRTESMELPPEPPAK